MDAFQWALLGVVASVVVGPMCLMLAAVAVVRILRMLGLER